MTFLYDIYGHRVCKDPVIYKGQLINVDYYYNKYVVDACLFSDLNNAKAYIDSKE